MKKISFLVSILLVIALVFTGCGNSADDKKDSSTAAAAGEKTADGEKLTSISFKAMSPHFGIVPVDTMAQKEWHKSMEEYMGMKLDIEFEYVPWAEYGEKVKLVLSSGEIPDVLCAKDRNDIGIYGNQGMFLDIAKYSDLIPNYKKMIDESPNGKDIASDKDGHMWGFGDVVTAKSDRGSLICYPTMYRYDIFQKHGIKIPQTIDEFYNAAKTLKGLYPKSYPINQSENYVGLSMFYGMNHVNKGIYWNGNEYVYGALEDSVRDALIFVNKLYKEKLMDPEFFIDNFEQAKKKALNGTTFIWPAAWFNFAKDLNDNKEANVKWVVSQYPTNSKNEQAWHEGQDLSKNSFMEPTIGISAKTKYPEQIVKILDYQFSDKMMEIINWGVEGTTFTRTADGKKDFVPEIKNAANPWEAGNKYGIRASSSCRPGIQFAPADGSAFINFAPNDPVYMNGELKEIPYEKAMPDVDFEKSGMFFPRSPFIQYNKDELQNKSNIMTAIDTYVNEMEIKFVTGEVGFDKWEEYKAQVEKLGDYKSVLKMMNDKAKALK